MLRNEQTRAQVAMAAGNLLVLAGRDDVSRDRRAW